MKKKNLLPAAILACLLPVAASADSSSYSTFDAPGGGATWTTGLNNNGVSVGYYQDSSGITQGFINDNGMFSSLSVPIASLPETTPGNTYTTPTGINNNGDVVGYLFNTSPQYALVVGQELINNVYTTVSQYKYLDSGYTGFVENNGSWTFLNDPNAATGTTQAQGINNNGVVVGSFTDAGSGMNNGFVESNGAYTSLSAPGAVYGTVASGINNSGVVVGSFFDGAFNSHGFVENNGVYTVLDVPGALDTTATGINNNGQVVGYFDTGNGALYNFVESNGVFSKVNLNVPNAANGVFTTGINDQGQIAGNFADPDNVGHGIVLTSVATTVIVPEPEEWVMLLAGLGMLRLRLFGKKP